MNSTLSNCTDWLKLDFFSRFLAVFTFQDVTIYFGQNWKRKNLLTYFFWIKVTQWWSSSPRTKPIIHTDLPAKNSAIFAKKAQNQPNFRDFEFWLSYPNKSRTLRFWLCKNQVRTSKHYICKKFSHFCKKRPKQVKFSHFSISNITSKWK